MRRTGTKAARSTHRSTRLPRSTRLTRSLATALAAIIAATGVMAIGAGTASADPSANAWLQIRLCESSNRYDIDTGNGYYGAYQFNLSTWASVGGTGKPSDAKPAEQDYRALMLYRKRGWQPWTCAVMARLSEDSDARSGIMPPEPASFDTPYSFVNSGSGTAAASSTRAAVPWPGQEFGEGDFSDQVSAWQKQIAALGYAVIGTGYVGPSTVAAVRDIQAKAGLDVTGVIGPETWEAAWSLAATSAGGTAAPNGGTAAQTGGTDQDAVFRPQTKAECGVGASRAPAAPAGLLSFGQTKLELQCFQWQAALRGAPLSGTAYFGSATLTVVATLQQQNGITDEVDASRRAVVGPRTWVAAWQGAASF